MAGHTGQLERRLERLERRGGDASEPIFIFLRFVPTDGGSGEYGHAMTPGGKFTRLDGESPGAFLQRVYRSNRVSKPKALMTDNEARVWAAGESEDAALHYQEHGMAPKETTRISRASTQASNRKGNAMPGIQEQRLSAEQFLPNGTGFQACADTPSSAGEDQ